MSKPSTQYRYLAPKPKSSYKQLWVYGHRVMARTLYGMFMSEDEPRTVEQIAADYEIPVEAVREAIEWCQSDPPELRRDMEMDALREQFALENDPTFPQHGRVPPMTEAQRAEYRRRFPR